MARKKPRTEENLQTIKNSSQQVINTSKNNKRLAYVLAGIVSLLAIVLYSQTITFDYTLDDLSAISSNKIVNQGISGIPELLRTDYWYGYTDKLRGHQYRPLSLVMFALENQLSPNNPVIGHAINVILFALTCYLLFFLIYRLLNRTSHILPFIVTILFAAHPIHTEVVSNIKSRDEILCFLFGIASIFIGLRYFKTSKIIWALLSGLLVLLSIMSKETGIVFTVLVPLTLFVFREIKLAKLAILATSFIVFTSIYFLLRYMAVHDVKTMDIIPIDNTLVLATTAVEKYGTAFSILLRYIGLLIAPVSLSYDYSYAQIPIVSISDKQALLGMVLYSVMFVYALWKIRKKQLIAYGILFYLISLAPVSNIFLTIGSTMAERFLYIPSFGFCLIIGLLLTRLIKSSKQVFNYSSLLSFVKIYSKPIAVTLIIGLLYSIKTISRNQVWQNNTTLFASGIVTAENSARTHFNWGFTNVDHLYRTTDDPVLKQEYLSTAKSELQQAFSIFPGYYEVGKPLGEVFLKENDFNNAINNYDKYLYINPNDISTLNNKAAALLNLQKYTEAQQVLQHTLSLSPNDTTALKNMGKSYAYLSQFSTAATFFEKTIAIAPGVKENYRLAGMAYQFMGDTSKARMYLNKAASIQQ